MVKGEGFGMSPEGRARAQKASGETHPLKRDLSAREKAALQRITSIDAKQAGDLEAEDIHQEERKNLPDTPNARYGKQLAEKMRRPESRPRPTTAGEAALQKQEIAEVSRRMKPPTERELGRQPVRGLDAMRPSEMSKKQRDEVYEQTRTRMAIEDRAARELAEGGKETATRKEQILEYETGDVDLAATIERVREAQARRRAEREAAEKEAAEELEKALNEKLVKTNVQPKSGRAARRKQLATPTTPEEQFPMPADDEDNTKVYAEVPEIPDEEQEEAG